MSAAPAPAPAPAVMASPSARPNSTSTSTSTSTSASKVRMKSNKTRGELAVQGTSDDAAVSKLSASELGYFTDPFLPYFVSQPSRRPPLINRGYYTRVAAIRSMIDEFLTTEPEKPHQIVSLGAGADTTYFRLKKEGRAPAQYFEVDFAELLLNKLHIIHRHKPLQQLIINDSSTSASASASSTSTSTSQSTSTSTLTSTSTSSPSMSNASNSSHPSNNHHVSSPSFQPSPTSSSSTTSYGVLASFPGYHLITADLRHIEQLESGLVTAGIDFTLPTLFLAECVLIYMHAKESAPVISWCGHRFTGGSIFINYEQILPDDAFGRTMIDNLNHRGCSLLGYAEYPTLEAHHQRYLSLGWKHHVGWDMNDIYKYYLDRQDTKRIESLELFDEYEEWHMISAHYHISVAANDADPSKPMYSKIGIAAKNKTAVTSPYLHATGSTPHKEAQLKAILEKRAQQQAVSPIHSAIQSPSPTQRPVNSNAKPIPARSPSSSSSSSS